MAELPDELRAELEKLKKAEQQRFEYERLKRKNLFWKMWFEACESRNLRRKIIGVASRRYNFIFSVPEISNAFVHEVMERCLSKWDKYDLKYSFDTWVIWQARSLALEIIRTGQKVPRSGPLGIGLSYPYNLKIEYAFTELLDEDSDEIEPEFEFEPTEEHILEIRQWILEEESNDTTGVIGRIVDAILMDVPSQKWCDVPSEQTIAMRSGLSSYTVKRKLEELRRRYLARFGTV